MTKQQKLFELYSLDCCSVNIYTSLPHMSADGHFSILLTLSLAKEFTLTKGYLHMI